MIRQHIELTYPTLDDAQARGPADVATTLASIPLGYQLAGPLGFVEREVEEGDPPAHVTRGIVGFEVDRADGAPALWPGAFDPPPLPAVTPTEET